MTGTEQLLQMSREDLAHLIEYLYVGGNADAIPEGFNLESDYKDALYSGYIDADMEFTSIVPALSHIEIKEDNIYLNGDIVELIPKYKSIELRVKGYRITGLIKAEIIARMILNMQSLKIGTFMEWDKYLIQYKNHTLVANTKGAIAGLKLLKDDYMARKMYTASYPRTTIVNWRELAESEKIYGSAEISMPNIVDQKMEEVYIALETLEDASRYTECANLIAEYGWSKQ